MAAHYSILGAAGFGSIPLSGSTDYVKAWMEAGGFRQAGTLVSVLSDDTHPDDPKHVSNEQLRRHLHWRFEIAVKRQPHRAREFKAKIDSLVLQFGDTRDSIPQPHRWEFLERVAAMLAMPKDFA